jgi:hypothetical protein
VAARSDASALSSTAYNYPQTSEQYVISGRVCTHPIHTERLYLSHLRPSRSLHVSISRAQTQLRGCKRCLRGCGSTLRTVSLGSQAITLSDRRLSLQRGSV